MAYKKTAPEKSREITVSDVFINEYMPDANGNYVKVYFLGLSQCSLEKPMSQREMADRLSLLESDVVRAWKYWADKKVVKFDGENVEFLDIVAQKNVTPIETKPVYYADEIASSAAANFQLSDMFQIVEKILNKPLNSTDLTVLYSLYDYYGMPLDVIPMLVTYCIKNGKKSMRQIEKTAGIWIEKGIESVEDAESYLKKAEEYNRALNRLKSAMGVTERNFSPTEMKYINSWLFDMKMSFEMIMHAYDLCTTNTGKLSVKYMNTVLTNWYNDVKITIKNSNSSSESKSKAVPTKFTNFDQRDFDYDEFEKKSMERIGNK